MAVAVGGEEWRGAEGDSQQRCDMGGEEWRWAEGDSQQPCDVGGVGGWVGVLIGGESAPQRLWGLVGQTC